MDMRICQQIEHWFIDVLPSVSMNVVVDEKIGVLDLYVVTVRAHG